MYKKLKVLVIGNNKGGVGKTFLAKTLADYFALIKGLRVYLIDLDPQTNLSRRYLDMRMQRDARDDFIPPQHPQWEPSFGGDGTFDTSDIWRGTSIIDYPTEVSPNIHILPANAFRLAEIELVRAQDVYEQVVAFFKDFIAMDETEEQYDVVILDTRPSKGPLVQAALNAATHLLIPTQMEVPSIEGLYGMLSLYAQANNGRSDADRLELVGILPNMFKTNTVMHETYLKRIRDDGRLGDYIAPISVHDWVGYKESMQPKAPSLFTLPPSDKCRRQMEQVGDYVFSRLFHDDSLSGSLPLGMAEQAEVV